MVLLNQFLSGRAVGPSADLLLGNFCPSLISQKQFPSQLDSTFKREFPNIPQLIRHKLVIHKHLCDLMERVKEVTLHHCCQLSKAIERQDSLLVDITE